MRPVSRSIFTEQSFSVSRMRLYVMASCSSRRSSMSVSSIFFSRARSFSASISSELMRLPVPSAGLFEVGLQASTLDVLERHAVFFPIKFDNHIVASNADETSREPRAPIHGRREMHAHALAGEALEVGALAQHPLDARR